MLQEKGTFVIYLVFCVVAYVSLGLKLERKLQIKCDAAKPQCNWCHHHDIQCTFSRTRGRRKKQPANR